MEEKQLPHKILIKMNIVFSVFMDSCIRQKYENKIWFWLYHLMYSTIISIIISIIPSIAFLIIFDTATIDIFALSFNIALFINVCLLSIIVINRNYNEIFSLPQYILNGYFILRKINFKKRAVQEIVFFLIVYLSLLLIFLGISTKLFPDNYLIIFVFSIFLFMVTLLIYCEASVDKYKRAEKQFLLWLLLFCMLLFFTIYNLPKTFATFQNDTIINIVLLFIGLLFNFALVMDKSREFFGYYYQLNKDELEIIWAELGPKYDFRAFMKIVDQKLGDSKTVLIEMKKLWNEGQKGRIILNLIVIPLLFFLLFYVIQFITNHYEKEIQLFITSSIGNLFNLWKGIFNNDENLSIFILILAGLLYLFFWNVIFTINSIKEVGLKSFFTHLEENLLLLLAVIFIIGIIFNLQEVTIFKNLLFNLLGLIVLSSILVRIADVLKR